MRWEGLRVDAVAKAMPQSGLTVVVNINTAGGGRCIMYLLRYWRIQSLSLPLVKRFSLTPSFL